MYSSAHIAPKAERLATFNIASHMREAFSDMFREFKVDLALWGHIHAYERTCAVYHEKCHPEGTVHLTIGMAGKSMIGANEWVEPPPEWSLKRGRSYGYSVITTTATSLHFQLIDNDNGQVLDEMTLTK